MTFIKAHYDGKVFVPDCPVDLPPGYELEIAIPSDEAHTPSANHPLKVLADVLDELPSNPDWPQDGAAQHDHYLYGTPKKP